MSPSTESKPPSTALYDFDDDADAEGVPPPTRARRGPGEPVYEADEEYVTLPPSTRSGPRLLAVAGVLVLVVLVLAGGRVFWAGPIRSTRPVPPAS